jgi:putative DNA-invertase from lambdoid prophage Rac
MRYYAYCRVSTQIQADRHTIENQRAIITAWADRSHHIIVKFYCDEAYSGMTQDRPAFQQMLTDLETNADVGGIVVAYLSRLGRSVWNIINLIQSINVMGKNCVFVNDNIDLSTAPGKLQFHLLAAIAEYENELIRERMSAGVIRARANGVKFGRPKLELNVKEIERLKKMGMSLRAIARLLGCNVNTVIRRRATT